MNIEHVERGEGFANTVLGAKARMAKMTDCSRKPYDEWGVVPLYISVCSVMSLYLNASIRRIFYRFCDFS